MGRLELMEKEKGIWSEFAEEEMLNNQPSEEEYDEDEDE